MTLDADAAAAFIRDLTSLPDSAPITLVALPPAPVTKAAIIAIAQGAGLNATSFVAGDPSERHLEYTSRAMAAWNSLPQQAIRAVFFALATDPGDVDDFGTPDASADQTPRPGFLSAFGADRYGTIRGEATNATSFVTIKNNGTSATLPFGPGDLTFEASTLHRSDGGTPTYVNTADPSIYTGLGGTIPPIAPGATFVFPLPVLAQQLGSYGSAGVNLIDTVVTQTFGSLVVVASTQAIGEDREPRGDYINRCLLAPDANAPGGPMNAYRRAMNTGRDGTVLQRFDGSGAVTINQAYVSTDSATGAVTIYYAGPSGAVDSIDVSSANANILGIALGVITEPLGVDPDGGSIGPLTNDPNIIPANTPGGASCTNTTVNVTYSVKIRASKVPGGASAGTYTSGGSPPSAIANIFSAISNALGSYLLSTGIGGLDQVAGAGVVYTADLPGVIRDAQSGLYDPVVTTPGGATTAIALGHIAVAGTISGTMVVT